MARPRKISDHIELLNRMYRCAEILYLLRYGRKGAVMIRQRAPYEWETFEQMNAPGKQVAPRSITVIEKMDSRNKRALVSQQRVVGFMEVEKEDFSRLKREKPWRESRGLEILLLPPVDSNVKAWNQLRRERTSKAEIVEAAERIRRWTKRFRIEIGIGEDSQTGQLVRIDEVIRNCADQLRQAKTLPHYPQTNRGSSEDKRIQFLAKVIAGFSLGASPLYATKKLSRVPYTKQQALGWSDWATRYPFPKEPKNENQGEAQ